MSEVFHSKVYTDRPAYADFDAPAKFEAIKAIIAKRLIEHPNAICSYSGGSDSDILMHLIESVRGLYSLPPVKYAFFNTGLEMKAIKEHVAAMREKYNVEITEYRPKKNIVLATREYGVPFVSKIMSAGLEGMQKKNIPLSIADEYANAENKIAKRAELKARYPGCETTINFLCCCNSKGEERPNIQLVINSSKYMLDFIKENPIPFKVSNRCCDYCKKQVAHSVQKNFGMIITGERRDEGGMRSVPRSDNTSLCFTETASGQYRLRPLYYVSDADKAWYKEYYGLRYSDAYEVYGLARTGCCGCSISSKAVEDLEKFDLMSRISLRRRGQCSARVTYIVRNTTNTKQNEEKKKRSKNPLLNSLVYQKRQQSKKRAPVREQNKYSIHIKYSTTAIICQLIKQKGAQRLK